MTVTAIRKDAVARTLVLDAEFDAPPSRVWQLWADPRQLERWWGPPTYPATVTSHHLHPGGRVEYHMTGPEGDRHRGYWEVIEADPPHTIRFRDGFADADGSPDSDMPLSEVRVTIEAIGDGRTRMSITSAFPDTAAMDQLLAMGMEEGLKEAVGQIDAILADDAASGPTVATQTLDVPGATLVYDVRQHDGSSAPTLFLIGSPMGAAGFATLAGHFGDRTVVTYDPRGSERSTKDDPASESTPLEHAEDLHRIVEAVGAGPIDLFASSGGAVNALALVAAHPDDVRMLVAHEPPLASILPDHVHALAATRAIDETYRRSGWGAGMAHFIAVTSHRGLFDAESAAQPAPDPAAFGLPSEEDGSRTDPLLGQNLISCTHYEPDWAALQAASTRIVVVAGAESDGELAHRAAVAAAERLDLDPVIFPSHHAGFLGGEYGQTGDPDAFAAALGRVLADA